MNHRSSFANFLIVAVVLSFTMTSTNPAADRQLHLNLRSRVKTGEGAAAYKIEEQKAAWDAMKTALIICDMWDDHWCKSAARRVTELARPMNEVVKEARAKGLFIIHSPSSVVKFYENTPQRKRA